MQVYAGLRGRFRCVEGVDVDCADVLGERVQYRAADFAGGGGEGVQGYVGGLVRLYHALAYGD